MKNSNPLTLLRQEDVKIALDNGELSVDYPAGWMTDERRQYFRENKAKIIELLQKERVAPMILPDKLHPIPAPWQKDAWRLVAVTCPKCSRQFTLTTKNIAAPATCIYCIGRIDLRKCSTYETDPIMKGA